MISKMPDDDAKFALLDKLFRVMSLDDMTQLLGQDIVVGKLKGLSDNFPGPVSQLVTDSMRLESDLVTMRIQMQSLQADFVSLLRIMAKPSFDYSAPSEFTTLKNRHGIY